MNIIFDEKGFLVPPKPIPLTLEEFKSTFVDNINSAKRHKLYEGYLEYNSMLKSIMGLDSWIQWIDGSFVTQKQNPDDIDLTNFLDVATFSKFEKQLFDFQGNKSKKIYGVDAYFVAIRTEEMPQYEVFTTDKAYWYEQFTNHFDKRHQKLFHLRKGFIELTT